MRRLTFAILLVGLVAVPVAAQGSLTVGIDQDSRGEWSSIVTRFESETGIRVLLQGYSQIGLAQQAVLHGIARATKLNLIMVHQAYGPGLSRYLADLSADVDRLTAAGLEIVEFGGKPVGVSVPFASDWFLAVLSWPRNPGDALRFFEALLAGPTLGVPESGPAVPSSSAVAVLSTTKISRTAHNVKLDGTLDVLLSAVQATAQSVAGEILAALPSAARSAISGLAALYGVPFSPTTSTVTVVMEPLGGRPSPSNVAALSAIGISRSAIEVSSTLIKVNVPLSLLGKLASQIPGIGFIRPPYTPYPLAIAGQGVAAIGANAFHAAGLEGSGVKIGIIDLGFAGLSQAQARGDLPYTVQQHDVTGTGLTTGFTHGTAVAEIAHEIAPGAELHLIKIADEVDLDLAVAYCLDHGIDVVNHSLGWYNTNFYDGAGTIADIARRAVSGGILWVNAAGNEAENHWEGSFADANSDTWHDQSLSLYATSGSQIILYLTWNDWPQASTDYDLYLYDPVGNLLASSTKHQTGTEEPTESIRTTTSTTGTFTIRIKGSGSRSLEFYSLYQTLSPAVAASSILAPANVADVVTVGAIDHSQYATGPQQPYSSQGPTNSGLPKPDLCGPDDVSTGTSPYTNFAGTSGAAPHAAGAAALLLSQDPSLSEPALRSRLLAATIPMGSSNTYGRGRLVLSLPASPNQPPTAAFAFTPPSPTAGAQVTFDGSASTDTDGVIVSHAWTFGDGGTASGPTAQHVYAAPGHYTVGFTVTDDDGAGDSTTRSISVGVAARPDLVVGTATHSPGAPALGQTVTFSVTVANQGTGLAGPFRVHLAGTSSATHAFVPQLAAAASSTLILHLALSQSHETFQVTVDDLDQIDESNEGNNTYSVIVDAVTPAPTADAGGPYSGPVGVAVNFDASGSTGTITTYDWTFGDGANGSGMSPSHVYNAPGTYSVDLTVTDGGGRQSTDTTTATITSATPPLSIALALPKASYEVGEPIVIEYSVNRGAYAYLCEVNASGAVTLLYPNFREPNAFVSAGSHALPAGSYTLAVSEPVGDDTLYAFAATGPLSGFPTSFGASFPLLSSNPSAFLNGVRQTMQSQFAPGETAEDALTFEVVAAAPTAGAVWVNTNPQGAAVSIDGSHSGSTPSQVMLPQGTHTLTLTLAGYETETRPFTISAGQTTTVNVNLVPIVVNQNPVASFTVSTATPLVGQTVQFNASASYDPDGSIISYAWQFGDGATGFGITAFHAYAAPGSVTARLTVTDNHGATGTTSRTITVAQPQNQSPVASFTVSTATPLVGQTVQFNASASYDPDGSIISYAWQFGDGATGSGITAFHAYATPGSVTARLTVTDNQGATHTATQTLTVGSSTPPVGLLAHWRFNEGSGSTASDSSGNGLHGAVQGSAWTTNQADGTPTLAYDGHDDFVTVPHSTLLTFSGPFTIEAWIHSTNLSGYRTIVVKRGGATEALYGMWTNGDRLYATALNDTGTGQRSFTGDTRLSLGIWYHVAMRRDTSGEITLWVNGSRQASSITITGPITPPEPLYIGRHSADPAHDFVGSIDEVRIHDRALDPSEFNLLPSSYVPPAPTPPTNLPPVASFTYSPSPVRVGRRITFDADYSDPDGQVVKVSWTFGDGAFAIGGRPRHEFRRAGTYTVTLTVLDNDGAETSVSKQVVVQ